MIRVGDDFFRLTISYIQKMILGFLIMQIFTDIASSSLKENRFIGVRTCQYPF